MSPANTHHYDAVVIGAGPAGGAMAAGLAKAGKKVALVESVAFGGTCPLRGCNPKKVLLAGAEAVALTGHLVGKGVIAGAEVAWPELQAFKDSFVEPIPEEAENAYMELGIETWHGLARFIAPDRVLVHGDEGGQDRDVELNAEHIALGPGLRPRDLPIPGAELCLDSTGFLNLPELPRRMVFIGGGFVAFELAHIAARSGAEVTVLVRSRPLKQFDPDMVETMLAASRDAGLDIRLGTDATAIEQAGNGPQPELLVRLSHGGTLEADAVVNAAGRVPDLEPLDLEAGGVEHSARGVTVNQYQQSVSNPRVYAAGDAADTPFALTPTAVIEARAAVANMLHGNSAQADYTGVPSVCFTIPPLASVGLSEKEAREQGLDIKVRKGGLPEKFAWKRLGETHGAYKLIEDKGSGLLVGAHLCGHLAEEMVNTLALAIRARIPLATLKDTVWAYPTCTYYLQYML